MVYISPPHLASSLRPSYAQTYNAILAAHRRSPLTAAASVIVLVAPDLDALCAARMLADLFKQDDVMHRIIPVCGMTEMEDMRDELVNYHDVRTPLAHRVCLCCYMSDSLYNAAAYSDHAEYGWNDGPHL
jgi:cell division control protein 45